MTDPDCDNPTDPNHFESGDDVLDAGADAAVVLIRLRCNNYINTPDNLDTEYYCAMSRSERYLPLADIASTQWGMITTTQARQVGVTPQQIARLAGSGVLERFHHGVYILNGVPRDRLTDLKAAWLSLDVATTAADRLALPSPDAVVSHRSAAHIHDLGDIDADINEFTTAMPKRSRHKDIRIHRRTLRRADWTIIDGLPTTTVAATLADLAATQTDGGHLGAALRDALVHGQIRTAEAVAALRPYAADYDAALGDGQTLVRFLLTQAGGLSRTLAAQTREFGWLAEQLDTAGNRRKALDAMLEVANQYVVDEELLRASGIGPT